MAFNTTVQEQWRGKEVKVKGQKVVGKTAFEIGLVVEGQAKLLAPVSWGYLAASITTQSMTTGTEPSAPQPSWEMMAAPKGSPYSGPMKISAPTAESSSSWPKVLVLVGTPVFYGPYVEFGTVRSDAQPFLRPALDLAKGRQLTILMHNGRLHFKEYLK